MIGQKMVGSMVGISTERIANHSAELRPGDRRRPCPRRVWFATVISVVTLAGCSREPAAANLNAAAATRPQIAAAGAVPSLPDAGALLTRYRRGDYVVYRYTGAFTSAPVELRERIAEQNGEHLVIEVVATRGAERRRWQQEVTDTPENEQNNVVDALYEITDDGARHKLENRQGADLMRLYEWTILMPDGKATNVRVERATLDVAGRAYECKKTTGDNRWRGRAVRFESVDCPEFLWTHGRSRFWDPTTGEDILSAVVTHMGRAPSTSSDGRQ